MDERCENRQRLTIAYSLTACKLIDELIELRLFREEKESWIEKAVITRVWICCTTRMAEETPGKLQELLETVTRNLKAPLSPQATHAAQTVRVNLSQMKFANPPPQLLWKKVEEAYGLEQYTQTEDWCRTCLHPLLEKAGDVNKSKIARQACLPLHFVHDANAV